MEDKKKKVQICVPVEGSVFVQFFYRYLRLLSYLVSQPNLNFQPAFSNVVPLEKARNALADGAVSSGADYVFWLDSDVLLTEAQFQALWIALHEKDGTPEERYMVSGIYYEKEEPYEPVLRLKDGAVYQKVSTIDNKPFKVHSAGFGAVLMKALPLRLVHKKTNGQCFKFTDKESEDLYFFDQAKDVVDENGKHWSFDLWAIPDVQCSHMGSYVTRWHFDHFQQDVMQSVKELADYLKMDATKCFYRCIEGAAGVSKAWRAKFGDVTVPPENEVMDFYRTTPEYVYDLTWYWYHSKYVKVSALASYRSVMTKILDFGCGIGDYGLYIAENSENADIDFYEINKPNLDYLKYRIRQRESKGKFAPGVITNVYDEQTFKWENDKYDCILAMDVLEHVNDPVAYAKKLRGMLKRNGVLLAFVAPKHHSQPQHIAELDLTKVGFIQSDITTFRRDDSDFALDKVKRDAIPLKDKDMG